MRRQRGSLLLYGLIALAILAALAGIGRSIYNAGFDAAKLECEEAAREQREIEVAQAAEAGTKLENGNAKAKIVYRTITRDVDKIVERPVYRNICLDSDGLRNANAALIGALTPAGKPDDGMPGPNPSAGRDGGDGAAKTGGGR